MDTAGCVWVGESYLKEWQVTDKIIEWIIFPIHIQPFTNDSNSKIITHRVSKFINGYEGMCMSEGKFFKPWQVRDKIIEWFFLQFIFYIYEWLKLKK